MKYKIITLMLALILLTIMPVMAGQGDLYKIYPDKVLINQEEVQDSDIWINSYHTDSSENKVYHIDSLRNLYIDENNESNNERVLLYLPYKVQPDWIQHINHKGESVGYYFPTNENWEWEYECDEGEEDCSLVEGNVILRVDKIDEGLGSNTFPIGITGPTWARDGQFAGEFDGVGSLIGVSNDNSFDYDGTKNNITISFWYKSSVFGSTPNIIHDEAGGVGGFVIILDETDSLFRIRNSSDGITDVRFDSISDVWTNLICKTGGLNGINLSCYNNGIFQNSSLGTTIMNASNLGLGIGARANGNNNFNGSIDEVLIYNRSLTQTEITSLFNNYTLLSTGPKRTGTPSTDGLVLDINFDDFSVADVSGNGNNGINTNVSFGVVEDINVTLVENTDYSISGSTLTILNDAFQWRGINIRWDFTASSSCSAIDLDSIEEQFGLFATGLLAFLGIIGTILGVVWLVMYVKKLFNKETGINTLTA